MSLSMRKRLSVLGALVAVVVLVSLVLSLMGALPGTSTRSYAATVNAASTWVSGISVMNQGSAQANVTIRFYDQSGNLVTTLTGITIPPGGVATYYSPTQIPGLSDGFIGSAVVESDQPVAATVNTGTPNSTGSSPSDPLRIGTAGGVNSPATGLYFPQVERHYYNWNSTMYVQNTAGSAATANIQYISRDGSTKWNTSASIPAYSGVALNQADQSNLGENWVGSAVVTSTAALAGVVNMFGANTTAATSQIYSYNAFSQGATSLYLAKVVKNYYGFTSGVTVQNIGTSSTNVTITYYMGGNTYSHSTTLGPKQPWVVYLGNTNPGALPTGLPDSYGSAIVTSSSQPIVGIVNEEFRGSESSQFAGFGYTVEAFRDGQQTTTVTFPKVSTKFYGYSSGIQVQNVGSSATTMTATFTERGSGGRTTTINSPSIAPGTAWAIYLPSVLPSSWQQWDGAATVTASQNIVGMATQAYRPDAYNPPNLSYGTKYGDSNSGYNGLNQ